MTGRRIDDVIVQHDMDDEAMILVPERFQLPDVLPTFADWAEAAVALSFPSDEWLEASPEAFTAWAGFFQRLAETRDLPDMALSGAAHEIFVHYRHQRPDPLVVATFLLDAEGTVGLDVDSALKDVTEADDPLCIEAPIVEATTAGPGPGIRVIRYRDFPDEGLLADLRYAWHIPEHEVIYLLRTLFTSPGRLMSVMEDLEAFGGTIRLVKPRSRGRAR